MDSFPLAAGGGWYISLCLCVRFLEVASLGSRDVAKLCHGHGVVALLLLFACCGLVLCSPAIARVRLVLGIVVLAGAGGVFACVGARPSSQFVGWLFLRVAGPTPACASSPTVCAFCCDCECRTPTTALTTGVVRLVAGTRCDVVAGMMCNVGAMHELLLLSLSCRWRVHVEWDGQV